MEQALFVLCTYLYLLSGYILSEQMNEINKLRKWEWPVFILLGGILATLALPWHFYIKLKG